LNEPVFPDAEPNLHPNEFSPTRTDVQRNVLSCRDQAVAHVGGGGEADLITTESSRSPSIVALVFLDARTGSAVSFVVLKRLRQNVPATMSPGLAKGEKMEYA